MTIKVREPQQLYDDAFVGLFQQGQAGIENSGCRYRTADGLKCGIGQLIDDEDYSSNFEGYDIRNCYDAQKAAGVTPETERLARTIQAAHDTMCAKDGMPFLHELWALAFTVGIACDLSTDAVFNAYMNAQRKLIEEFQEE